MAALRVVLVSYPIALVLLAALAVDRRRGDHPGCGVLGCVVRDQQAFGVWWFYAALGAGPDLGGLAADGGAGRRRCRSASAWRWGSGPGAIASVGVVLALVAVVLVSREATG